MINHSVDSNAQDVEMIPLTINISEELLSIVEQLITVLSIAAAATLCGMRGYLAISDWAQSLQGKARRRFGCRYQNNSHIVPSIYIIRDVLTRVDPVHIDRAIQQWNQKYGQKDEALAIDGKTMRNAIDEQGHQTHIMSAIGHQTNACYTQKK